MNGTYGVTSAWMLSLVKAAGLIRPTWMLSLEWQLVGVDSAGPGCCGVLLNSPCIPNWGQDFIPLYGGKDFVSSSQYCSGVPQIVLIYTYPGNISRSTYCCSIKQSPVFLVYLLNCCYNTAVATAAVVVYHETSEYIIEGTPL